jgi:hypothetical protein
LLVSEFTTASTLIGVSTVSQQPTTVQSSASSQVSSEKLLKSLAEQCLRQFFERSTSALPDSYSLKTKYFKTYPISMSTTTPTAPRATGTEHALHITLFFQQFTEKIASFLIEIYLLGKGGVRRKTATVCVDTFPCLETNWPTSILQKLKSLSSSNGSTNNNHL